MKTYNKITISNTLIIISAIFTLIAYIYPEFKIFGVNNYFYNRWEYLIYFLQFFTGTFIHGGFLHLFMNSMFLYYFGNPLEQIIGRKKYLIFFITATIFIGLGVTHLTNTNTIWISWFAMALLSYYTALLYSIKNSEYKWWLTALAINIWIWLMPQISFTGHFLGAIYWIIFFFINKKVKK